MAIMRNFVYGLGGLLLTTPVRSANLGGITASNEFNNSSTTSTSSAFSVSTNYPWGSTKGVSKNAFLDKIVEQLTVPELAQHLNLFYGNSFLSTNGLPDAGRYNSSAGGGGIGEMSGWFPQDSAAFNALQKLNIEYARIPVPILVTGECLHGAQKPNATIFPQNANLAQTFSPDLMHNVSRLIGLEVRAVGVAGCYAPVLDLSKDPRWGRTQENFGEDKFLAAKFAVAYIKGLQNDGNLTSLSSAFSTMKHMMAHGSSDGGRNIGPAHIGKRELWTEFALPFRDSVQLAGVKGVMMAYNTIDQESCAFNSELYDALDDWGFEGRILADNLLIYRSLKWAGTATDEADAVAKWLNGGVDGGGKLGGASDFGDWSLSAWTGYVQKALNESKLSEKTLRKRVKSQLSVKYDLGLFDNPYLPQNHSMNKYDTPEAQDVALQSAEESIVLLKNNGILPLSSNSSQKISIIGPFGDVPVVGSYVSNGIMARKSTLRSGISNYRDLSGVTTAVGSSQWLDHRANIIPYYAFQPEQGSSQHGLKTTYFYDQAFQNPAWSTVEAPQLSYDTNAPNGPNQQPILSNNSFSVRYEGYLTSPSTAAAALGVLVSGSGNSASLFIDDTLIITSKSGVQSPYCDLSANWWPHYAYNSTSLPAGLADFSFDANKVYKIRIDYVSAKSGAMLPAWDFVDRSSPNKAQSDAVSTAQSSDVILLAVGSGLQIDEETCDVSELGLSPNQTLLADEIFALGKPVILITYGSRPHSLPEYYNRAAAVVHAGIPGQAGGDAVANVLFGKINPSGRLAITIPYSSGTLPAYYNHQNSDYRYRYSDVPFTDIYGVPLTSAYPDNTNSYNPLYHFGFGMSYTTFSYGNLSCSKAIFDRHDTLKFTFTVTNTGPVAGMDVPQLYLQWRPASVGQPVRQLLGFSKIMLQPMETKNVEIELDVNRYLTSYNNKYDWGVDGTTFPFSLMHSSNDTTTNMVTLTYGG